MTELLPKLILTGLGAAVSPVAVIVLLTLMMKKKPLRNAFIFLVGFTITLVAIGLVVVFVLHIGGSGEKSALDDWIDLALGFLCLAFIPLSLRHKKKDGGDEAKDDSGVKPLRAFVLGILTMCVNSSTMVIYAAGMHIISQADLSRPEDVLSIALLTFVTLLSLLVPIFIYIVAPQKAGKVLASLKDWLDRHSQVIGAGVLAVFGVWLATKGALALF